MRGVTEPRVGTGRAQDPGTRHQRPDMGGAPVFVHTYLKSAPAQLVRRSPCDTAPHRRGFSGILQLLA